MNTSTDEALAALLRDSTAFKDAGQWHEAVEALYCAKALMLVSQVTYPAEAWCKLPLYLQQAGRFDESMSEFQFLLDDLPRRARHEAQLDNPAVGPMDGKNRLYKTILKTTTETVQLKRALAQKRETKRKAVP